MQHVDDAPIIGEGPTGLYSAFYSGIRGLQLKVNHSSVNYFIPKS